MASASPPAVMNEPQVNYYQDQGRDKFKDTPTNPLKIAKDEPVSTSSIDVDTASYSFVRRKRIATKKRYARRRIDQLFSLRLQRTCQQRRAF